MNDPLYPDISADLLHAMQERSSNALLANYKHRTGERQLRKLKRKLFVLRMNIFSLVSGKLFKGI